MSKHTPESIPGIQKASDLLADGNTAADRESRIARDNFRKCLRHRAMSLEDLSNASNVPIATLRRWYREGFRQPKYSHIEAVGAALGLPDPHKLLDPDFSLEVLSSTVDRSTNRAIDDVRQARPELFEEFSDREWEELYSKFGTGGPLTPEGVCHFAARINAKRELRRKLEILLETHHFQLLQNLVDVLYRDTEFPSDPDS